MGAQGATLEGLLAVFNYLEFTQRLRHFVCAKPKSPLHKHPKLTTGPCLSSTWLLKQIRHTLESAFAATSSEAARCMIEDQRGADPSYASFSPRRSCLLPPRSFLSRTCHCHISLSLSLLQLHQSRTHEVTRNQEGKKCVYLISSKNMLFSLYVVSYA